MHTQNVLCKSKKKSHLASQAISTLIQLTTNKQPITLLRPKSTTQRPQTTNHQVHDPDALYSSQTTQRAPSQPRGKFKIAVQIQPIVCQMCIGGHLHNGCVTTVTFQIWVHKPLTKSQHVHMCKSNVSRHSRGCGQMCTNNPKTCHAGSLA